MMAETLIVRHLPGCLSEAQKEDLLRHFGATSVRCMSDSGPLKHVAFATFEDTKNALTRLHQLEVFGSKLVVEYAKQKPSNSLPCDDFKSKENQSIENSSDTNKTKNDSNTEKEQLLKFFKAIHSSINGTDYGYPVSPLLQYHYPPASPFIIQNISQALLSIPKFYVQVLHLMNKMNLPPPFTPSVAQPVLPPMYFNPELMPPHTVPVEANESEIESDEDFQVNRTTEINTGEVIKRKKPRKRPRLDQLISQPSLKTNSSAKALDTAKVFELSESTTSQKKIEFNLSSTIDLASETEKLAETTGFGTIEPVAEPEKSTVEEVSTPCFMELDKYVSQKELDENRISKSEMKKSSVFRKYEAGEPTSRLYLKNLPKQVTEQDILFVYGKYVDWNSEQEANVFDIRLMKEGRMKGQAFVTFLNEADAKKALHDTNGYMFHGKPVVVQFARSAKPKINDDKSSKKK